jgi:hypothetical protein
MILVPTRGPEDWAKLLADPDRHWRRGHSAMAAALAWEAAKGLPPEIAAILGPEAELLLAMPEHKVRMPGRGRESQCDLFALVALDDGLCALAVEAKVDEPFGPTVGDWLAEGGPNRQDRLRAICELLGTGYPTNAALRYQLFHRTAAAVIEARRFRARTAAMVVHSFSQDGRWFEDFAAFCDLLGLEARPGIPLRHATPDGTRLLLGWAKGSPEHL